jgi:hypothetical protein
LKESRDRLEELQLAYSEQQKLQGDREKALNGQSKAASSLRLQVLSAEPVQSVIVVVARRGTDANSFSAAAAQ